MISNNTRKYNPYSELHHALIKLNEKIHETSLRANILIYKKNVSSN